MSNLLIGISPLLIIIVLVVGWIGYLIYQQHGYKFLITATLSGIIFVVAILSWMFYWMPL